MIARDARIVDHQVIFQPAPDANDRLDQGIEFDAIDDKERIWGERFDLSSTPLSSELTIPPLQNETSHPILPKLLDFLLLWHAEGFAREIFTADFF
jgi:hypothetical protein